MDEQQLPEHHAVALAADPGGHHLLRQRCRLNRLMRGR